MDDRRAAPEGMPAREAREAAGPTFAPAETVAELMDQLKRMKTRGETVTGSRPEPYTPDELAELVLALTEGIEDAYFTYHADILRQLRDGTLAAPPPVDAFFTSIPSLVTASGYRLNNLTSAGGLRQAFLETIIRDLKAMKDGPIQEGRARDARQRWAEPIAPERHDAVVGHGVRGEVARRFAAEHNLTVDEAWQHLFGGPPRD